MGISSYMYILALASMSRHEPYEDVQVVMNL
jgi:hypothetical protein